jgi:NIMA (never in mitosis gene a)-related kinase 1/4/5
VYKVKRLTDGQLYALKRVKILNLNEKEKDNALNEIRILASLRHQNVVLYKEAFWEEKSKSLWYKLLLFKFRYPFLAFSNLQSIIMEYADDGDLF